MSYFDDFCQLRPFQHENGLQNTQKIEEKNLVSSDICTADFLYEVAKFNYAHRWDEVF